MDCCLLFSGIGIIEMCVYYILLIFKYYELSFKIFKILIYFGVEVIYMKS